MKNDVRYHDIFNHICMTPFNPNALRKAKIVYNFGFSECNRVKEDVEILPYFQIQIN